MATEDLPDECLSKIFSFLSAETGGFAHALVCRRWRALAPDAQLFALVRAHRVQGGDGGGGAEHPRKPSAGSRRASGAMGLHGGCYQQQPQRQLPGPVALSTPMLLEELRPFRNLTALRLAPGSLQLLTDKLFVGLAAQSPELRHLAVSQQAAPVSCFNVGGLEALLTGCPHLRTCLLHTCGDVVELPDCITSLRELHTLEFGSWTGSYSWRTYPNLTALPAGFGSLCPSLRSLTLVSRSLHALPLSFSELTGLTELNIHSVELGDLPENMGNLSSLRSLRVRSQLLSALPESLGQLRSLSHLCLNFCNCLFELPLSFGQLRGLRQLEIMNCYALLQLPDTFCHLAALEKLIIHGCAHLGSLPENMGTLVNLRSMSLKFARRLKRLPPSLGHMASLESLEIQTCDRIEELPSTVGDLQQLKSLVLSGCRRITSLPEALCLLTGLTTIEVSECSGLKKVPLALMSLPSLTTCIFRDIPACT